MGGFFSKQANTTEALLNADNQAADYQSLKTTPRDNPREALQSSIEIILNATKASTNISSHDKCLSRYLKSLDLNYTELDDDASDHIQFLITQVERLLHQYKKARNKTIIESTLGNTVQTLLCLSKSHEDKNTEEKHKLFKPLASHIITKKNLKEITAKYLEYKSEKMISDLFNSQVSETIPQSWLEAKDNPILGALQQVLDARKKSVQANSSVTKKMPATKTTPLNPANNASPQAPYKKPWYLCCC